MRERHVGVLRSWLSTAALAALTACHSAAVRAPPAPDTRPPVDATYDWHDLLIVPFGVTLKDIPLTLHEVLLFRDQARGTGAGWVSTFCDGACFPVLARSRTKRA